MYFYGWMLGTCCVVWDDDVWNVKRKAIVWMDMKIYSLIWWYTQYKKLYCYYNINWYSVPKNSKKKNVTYGAIKLDF